MTLLEEPLPEVASNQSRFAENPVVTCYQEKWNDCKVRRKGPDSTIAHNI